MEETKAVGRLNFSLEDITSVDQKLSNRIWFVQIEKVKQWEAMKLTPHLNTSVAQYVMASVKLMRRGAC